MCPKIFFIKYFVNTKNAFIFASIKRTSKKRSKKLSFNSLKGDSHSSIFITASYLLSKKRHAKSGNNTVQHLKCKR